MPDPLRDAAQAPTDELRELHKRARRAPGGPYAAAAVDAIPALLDEQRSDAVNLRVLAAGIANGRPLADGWPEKLRGIAERLFAAADDTEAAADGATPAQPDEVLWEGDAIQATRRNSANTADVAIEGRITIPPWARIHGQHGQRVRVVATEPIDDPL